MSELEISSHTGDQMLSFLKKSMKSADFLNIFISAISATFCMSDIMKGCSGCQPDSLNCSCALEGISFENTFAVFLLLVADDYLCFGRESSFLGAAMRILALRPRGPALLAQVRGRPGPPLGRLPGRHHGLPAWSARRASAMVG